MSFNAPRPPRYQENAALKLELQTALSKLAVYEAGAGVASLNVRASFCVPCHPRVQNKIDRTPLRMQSTAATMSGRCGADSQQFGGQSQLANSASNCSLNSLASSASSQDLTAGIR